jgi:guanylate kinase
MRLRRSVSATTRPPRTGEKNGRDYYFLTPEEFERGRGDLLECARVHDHLYGTPAEPVRQAMAQGYCVLLVIDVQGAVQVREKVPEVLLVFVHAPDLRVLEARLRTRGSDDESAIRRRIVNAEREIERASRYDVHVINDDLDRAVEELASILVESGCGGRKNDD